MPAVLSLVGSWSTIAISIYLVVQVSIWFYPVALLLIANRQLSLIILSHDAVHRTLLPTPRINDFVGRIFCAFPVFISLSQYRKKHITHHGFLYSSADPDRGLYADFPMSLSRFLARAFGLHTFQLFIRYFTEILDYKFSANNRNSLFEESDFYQYIAFHFFIFTLLTLFSLWPWYFLLWVIPELVCLPYFWFMGALQHGPMNGPAERGLSRTIYAPQWLLLLALPHHVNFHAEHHLKPRVPHYHLPALAQELEAKGFPIWKSSFSNALKNLFLN